MDVILLYLVDTVLLPVLVTSLSALLLSRRWADQAAVLSLGLGFIVAFAGVFTFSDLWGTDVTRLIIWGSLITGLSLSLSPFKRRIPTALAALYFGLYLCLSPLSSLWREELVHSLLNEWVIGAWLNGSLIVIMIMKNSAELDDQERTEGHMSPAYFASLALSYAIAAPCVGLAGSASFAQLLGALGVATASIGVIGLLGRLKLTIMTYLSSYTALFLTLVSAHFYLTPAFPSSVASLILLAPLTALLTKHWRATSLKRVVMSLVVALPLLVLGLGLMITHELDKARVEHEADEFGVSY